VNSAEKEAYLREYDVLKKKGKPFFPYAVFKDATMMAITALATVGIPTLCMVLLLLLPFYDRNPERRPERRPVATTAGIMTIIAMAYLTFLGASAGSPTEIELEVAPQYELGKQVAAQSGCLACHKFGENGNDGPGPELTDIGARLPAQAIERTLINPSGVMPAFKPCGSENASPASCLPQEKFDSLVTFLASLQ
jgi:menaquinol-cytochrome c reductase cytochrome b/c subunit